MSALPLLRPALRRGVVATGLLAGTLPAQVAPAPPPASPPPTDDVVALSPFEVISEQRGYYGTNTVAGTRFNAKLEDLAAAITVITRAQMQDFAMLDLNDVFLYTAGTEGTGTFTDYTVDRNGSVADHVQLNPGQANRVRGLSTANLSFGNIETMGRTPLDPLGVDALELSRGPNATVFGLGNPSGTVNLVPASAHLSRNRAVAQVRADSVGGHRTSLDVNRVLKKGVLAIRGGAAFQHEGFVRRPSGVDTERYLGMVKFKPFKDTTVTGTLSYYRAAGNRPNATPPRDGLSYWRQSGRPTWDPVAQVVHVNGQTLGPFTNATGLPDVFNNSFTGSNHSYLFIEPGGVGYFAAPTTFANPAVGPVAGAQSIRWLAPSAGAGVAQGRFTAQPLFATTPAVSDRALYDWTRVNLAAVNRFRDRTVLSSVQLDHFFLNTARQTLALQAGFLREDSLRDQRNHVGIANDNGQSGQLLIDVNEKLLDGSPNPWFLRPYIGQDQPRTTSEPAKWDTLRAQLAYRFDFTGEPGLLPWLGQHQVSLYREYKYRISRRYSFREAILDDHPWIPAGLARGNQGAVPGGPAAALAITRSYLRYYVGDQRGDNVDYAPGDVRPGVYPFVWGSYPVSGGLPSGPGTFFREPATVGLAAVTDASGGPNNSQTILKTVGGVLQSHLFSGRLVTTLGLREDRQFQKAGATPQLLNPDGTTFDYASLNHWAAGDYTVAFGRTRQTGLVLRPFRGRDFLRTLDDAGPAGHFLAGALHGFALLYNRAGSFTPQDPRVNLALQALPNPSGRGRELGAALTLLDGRLVVRVNRYETVQENKSGGDAGTIAQRATRLDVSANAPFLLATQATQWVQAANPAFTPAQVQTEVARQIGLSPELQASLLQAFNAGTLSSTQDVVARGTEVELNINPARTWTIAASATDMQAVNRHISPDIARWLAQRLPVWTSVRDQRDGQLWWTKNYGGTQSAAQNYATFIEAPFSVVRAQEGLGNPQIRRYAAKLSSSCQLAGLADRPWLKRFTVGGALRWESRGAIGYYGRQALPAVITELDPARPIYDGAHAYADAFVRYRTKLWADRVGAEFQLNVRNLQENGRLQPIGAFPDGTPHSYRIVDPRQFILQATFDL